MDIIKVKQVASKGYAFAPAYLVVEVKTEAADYFLSNEAEKEEEVIRFKDAIEKVSLDLEELAKDSDIFAGHLTMVMDFAMHEAVQDKINNEAQNAELALQNTVAEFSFIFESMDDEYMRERAADVKDVGNRVLMALQNRVDNRFAAIKEPVIIVADDLTPSDTARMDLKLVKGFITRLGGQTSHVSIIARSLEIPAIVGVDDIVQKVKSGEMIALDAVSGSIYLNPDQATIDRFEQQRHEYMQKTQELLAKSFAPAITKDGHTLKVYANAGSDEEIKLLQEKKVDGIGLFRSEFLFMENTQFPTEDEQFKSYKQAAELIDGEIIIRTLDIGGDKELSYYEFEKEENPFLGFRAIRMCLAEIPVFKTQLRAILRASVFGKLKIMFPMIISLEELEESVKILNECKAELREEKIAFDPNIKIGIMIETPAAVFCARDLAQHVSFFSIGTNDLTQYTLAVDRGNKTIEHLYNTFHPAVMRSIKQIIDAAHEFDVEVGICGEFASDPEAAKILLGMGIDELSMAAGDIPLIKEIIRNLIFEEEVKFAENILRMSRTRDIEEAIQQRKGGE